MENRIYRMRPSELVEQRKKLPVAYIPLGTIEWHGMHNPLGADGLQAQELCKRCAREGGVVFPTVYYGESRVNSLLETDTKYQSGICRRLEIPEELMEKERFPYSGMEQIEHYQHHLVHIMAEAASYGFELAVFVAGHYPLVDHARAAILSYNQWAYDKKWKRIGGIAAADFLLLKDCYKNPGDHAGGWETSHLLASDPETVDLSLAEDEVQFGILSQRNPKDSTKEFGEQIYQDGARKILERVHRWFENPDRYMGHGIPLD